MVAVIVVAALLAGAHAEIKELSCMKTGNRDVSQCLFDGDNCNFVTDFANFANEWVSHRDWEANPVPGPNAVFVVESDVAPALDPSGALYMQVLQDRAGVQGNGTILSTTRSLKYGVVEATFKQSGVPGVVSSFILASNDLDEIDLEITGADLYNVNSNWYYRGKELLNAQGQNVNGYSYWTNDNNADVYHTYRIDWNAERIQWAINGVVFKTALANETTGYGFPSSPARISFGVWQTPFTSTWAGKGDPTTVPNPLPHVYFKSIKVSW
ncbi:hypothetical protein PBRA_000095 [Plasmodiophora brassicae]|uniref:GH16 domain-containing protein n=1 Tax=Plasmodiophora brassicae TaxID=37360 RepID=A0A0G4IGS9_PLABS|nr:hypothetical protein PBRA_000095 [Plasmodiophora brassicae]